MFGASGQVIPLALIFVSAFNSERMVESLSRSDRQTLVREVQAPLMEAAGGAAYVGRFDGGEFDIIIRGVDGVNDVAGRCQEILTAFFPPFEIGGISFSLSPKLGVALSPDHGFSPDALQRNADLALRYGCGSARKRDPARLWRSDCNHFKSGKGRGPDRRRSAPRQTPASNFIPDACPARPGFPFRSRSTDFDRQSALVDEGNRHSPSPNASA